MTTTGSCHPRDFHAGNCEPGIANIYNLRPIRDRVALTVCDGAFIQYDGGPQYKPAARLPFNSLLVTRDPVALDKLMWEYIDALRKAKRQRPLASGRGKPVHIAAAARLGLGTDSRSRIDLIEKKL